MRTPRKLYQSLNIMCVWLSLRKDERFRISDSIDVAWIGNGETKYTGNQIPSTVIWNFSFLVFHRSKTNCPWLAYNPLSLSPKSNIIDGEKTNNFFLLYIVMLRATTRMKSTVSLLWINPIIFWEPGQQNVFVMPYQCFTFQSKSHNQFLFFFSFRGHK